MAKRHPNGGTLEPVKLRYLSVELIGTPILKKDGAPIVHKQRPGDSEPHSQAFEIDLPQQLGGGSRCVLLHAVPDPVTGGPWVPPGENFIKTRLQEMWARPDVDGKPGHFMHWPIEADENEQAVSRKIERGSQTQDMYRDELGYRPVTKEMVVERLEEGAANFKKDQDERLARDPKSQMRFMAEVMAENTKTVMAGALEQMRALSNAEKQKPQQGAR